MTRSLLDLTFKPITGPQRYVQGQLRVSCVGCGALLHHLFSPRKFVTIRTPPDFFPTVIMGAHQSDVSPAGTGSMIPILAAAFNSSFAKFLNETGML